MVIEKLIWVKREKRRKKKEKEGITLKCVIYYAKPFTIGYYFACKAKSCKGIRIVNWTMATF